MMKSVLSIQKVITEIFINDKADEVVEERFESFLIDIKIIWKI